MTAVPSAVLLDVEGTTTPIDFVYRVLFPYARDHVARFLEAHPAEPRLAPIVAGLREDHGRDVAEGRHPPILDASTGSIAAYVRWLMDEDRKATWLKALQGLVWEEGFASGVLQGQVYDDVPPAFERWRAAGRTMAIFSSGSVLAQKLLFASTNHGDLRSFLAAYFDTTTGPKREPDSYRRIAAALTVGPALVLFVSDVEAELDAARGAGLSTALCVRDQDLLPSSSHRAIRTFAELD